MTIFIRSLFMDLHNRLERMITHLDSLTMETVAPSLFKKKAVVKLHALRTKITTLMESEILANDFFTPNTIILYNSINNEFIEIELFLYLPISRYDTKADGYFEKVINSIYSEIQSLQSIPFISTISNSETYYWAYSKYQMIAVPQGEEKHLLNLSDLYHEIGHLIFIQHERFLVGDYMQQMKNYYDAEEGKLWGRIEQSLRKRIKNAVKCWEATWSEELACDLIATYLVGPAYAWTNLKICAVSSGANEIYAYPNIFKEHPPDEVRMRAVLRMLYLIGHHDEAKKITSIWDEFLSVTQNAKPDGYDVIFPSLLVESISQNVFEGCTNIALLPYPEQLRTNTRPVSLIINEAWLKIREEPKNFSQWEIEQITNIRSLTFP